MTEIAADTIGAAKLVPSMISPDAGALILLPGAVMQ